MLIEGMFLPYYIAPQGERVHIEGRCGAFPKGTSRVLLGDFESLVPAAEYAKQNGNPDAHICETCEYVESLREVELLEKWRIV